MKDAFNTFIMVLGYCSFLSMIAIIIGCVIVHIIDSYDTNLNGLQKRLTHNDKLSKEAAKKLHQYNQN